jgi:hypothetical protein
LLPLPSGTTTADVTATIGPVTLEPGTYALVFGAGEFGAGGNAAATQNNTPIGPQSYFYWNSGTGGYVDGGYGNVRMYALNVVPEPSSTSAAVAVLAAVGARHQRRRRRDC